MTTGRVALVGAGPGDAGLLTRRGEELLRHADVVLCDRLVSEDVRALIRPDAEVLDVGKSRGRGARQEDITARLVEEARRGRLVVRLKGGDPFVFGRGGEELLALAEEGVDLEVVPGISSALAGPALAGIPVTHRGTASSLCILTAEEQHGPREDWAPAIAADTVVLLMGVATLRRAAATLVREGKAPDTPAAVVQDASRPGQRVVRATLATIADAAQQAGIRSPAIAVIGPTAELGLALARRFGLARPVALVTRAAHQAAALAAALRAHGVEPMLAPA
ncbi:MAG TPA: uroporphyrinogen-III C-methyltransferase, partial [Gaiellaceae bacterium]|nr:uroporphyrinogen-III C-methyltransferase [Gaiellaceae bacterium]